MKYGQVSCKMNTYSNEVQSNLMKVKICVMHDGTNLNGTKFSFENMRKAEESIKNVPILGYVKRDSYGELEDFDGHNMETRITDSDKGWDVETYYLEKPIGVIPESCNPRYEEIDGYKYLVVDGYVWKSYSNGAYKLIENSEFKGVSMEISIQNAQYDEADMSYEILDYQYEGVTVLGDDVPAAMGSHTTISKYSKCADYKVALEEICNAIYSLESEVNELENEVTEVVETEETVQEETIDATETTEEVEEVKVEDEVEEVETVEETTEVEVEETVTEEVEENPLEVFSILLDEIPGSLKEVAVKIHEKFELVNSELEKLREFKASKDKESLTIEVDNVISEFAELDMNDVSEIRTKAIDKEIEMELFREKLASLAYAKIKASKTSYSTVKKTIVPIIENNIDNEDEPYGGIFK